MKLLIITQVLDQKHPILGFFHRWVEEFAKHCSELHVIALQVGDYDLPPHVQVLSLGKEEGRSRMRALWRLCAYLWQYRHHYDSVFVHMNQVYVLLAGLWWRLTGKQIGLWYAHGTVTHSLRLAVHLVHFVFTSTPHGLQIDTQKRIIVGQGIDTTLFTLRPSPLRTSTLRLITVGRIAASKHLETLLEACAELADKGIDFHFTIVGNAANSADYEYEARLLNLAAKRNLSSRVTWHGPATQAELPNLLYQADIFIHDGATQSLDKVLLEAVATGLPVLSSNLAYQSEARNFTPDWLFTPHESGHLADKLTLCAQQESVELAGHISPLSNHIRNVYSIEKLVSGIVQRYETNLHRPQ